MCIAQNIDIIKQAKLWGLQITEEQHGNSGLQVKENNSKNVVLFLFDGLGYNILKENKDICPFLYDNLITIKSEPYSHYKENSYFFMNIKEGNKDVLKLFDNGENCRSVEWL